MALTTMIDKRVYRGLLVFFYMLTGTAEANSIYKKYTDTQGVHTMHIIISPVKRENKTFNRITKIVGYLGDKEEWVLQNPYSWIDRKLDDIVIEDFDKDGLKDIIILYGLINIAQKKNEKYYSDFSLAIVHRNKVAKIIHNSSPDDCFRYTEVDALFYSFPKAVIDRTIKVLEDLRNESYIPIVYDYKKQLQKKYKYLWDFESCGKSYPWNDSMFGYERIDGKRKVSLHPDFKTLAEYCTKSGYKEKLIRKLNPWINKDASNIPPNKEIIVPLLDKRGNYESK